MSLTSEKTKYEHVVLDDKGNPIIVGTNMKVNVPRAVTVGLRLRVDVITAYEDGADDMDDSAFRTQSVGSKGMMAWSDPMPVAFAARGAGQRRD